MKFETVTRKLYKNYIKAKSLDYVKKPLSWALYQTWKDVDKLECGRHEDSDVDLDIMLKACANAVSDRLEDGSTLFISDKDGKYEKYEWMTILDWIADVHSEMCERGD